MPDLAPIFAAAAATVHADDKWLHDRLAFHAAVDQPFSALVAAGASGRWSMAIGLRAQVEQHGLRAALDGVLEQRNRVFDAVRAQFTVDAVREVLRGRAFLLLHDLHDLAESADPGRESWRHAVVDALVAREEIECVLELLAGLTGEDAVSEQAVELCDEAAYRRLADLVDRWPEIAADASLARPAIADPDAWWLECAAPCG